MRRVLIIICLFMVGGSGAAWWFWRKPTSTAAEVMTPVAVSRGIIQRSTATTGRVVSNLDVDIKCKASGVVVKLPFDISDTVKKGDLVIELDPVDEQRAVSKAAAVLEASQARYEQARQNLVIAEAALITDTGRAKAALATAEVRARDARTKAERMADLIKEHLVSKEDVDTSATTAQQSESELKSAQLAIEELKTQELSLEVKRQDIRLTSASVTGDRISLENANQRLKETTVVAPIDGVVAARTVQIGTIISSGITNVGGGTAALTISDLSRLFVLASVDESDIGQVALGQDVHLTADAFPEKKFKGVVTRIATRGVNASNVVTFEVKIEVVGDGKAVLKPEMTTNVEIIVERKEDVLSIPSEALVRMGVDKQKDGSKEPGKEFAKEPSKERGKERDRTADKSKDKHKEKATWMVRLQGSGGAVEEKRVTIGITDGIRTEICEGLTEGDTVLIKANEPASQWRSSGTTKIGMPGGGRPY